MSEEPPSPNPAPRPKPRLRLDTATLESPAPLQPEVVAPELPPAPPPPPEPPPAAVEPVRLKLREAGDPPAAARPTLPPFSAIAKEPPPDEAPPAETAEAAAWPDVDTTISTPESRRRRWLLLAGLTVLAAGLWLWLQDRTKRDQTLLFPPNSVVSTPSSPARPVEPVAPPATVPVPVMPDALAVPEGGAEQTPVRIPVSPAEPLPTMARVSPVLAASAAIEPDAGASAGFRSFVANARITGVFQGSPSRAVINGKLRRGGETVDLELGIVFVGVDVEARRLSFADRNGAKVVRSY